MALKVGIIGNGNVGKALARGLSRAAHEVRAVGSDPAAVREAGARAGYLDIQLGYVVGMGPKIGFKLVH